MASQEQRREGWMVLGFTIGALAFLFIVGAVLQ
jgi:preprotein translocase subunit SecE